MYLRGKNAKGTTQVQPGTTRYNPVQPGTTQDRSMHRLLMSVNSNNASLCGEIHARASPEVAGEDI